MADHQTTLNDDRPIVLIHRNPSFDDLSFITDLLAANHFQVVESHSHSQTHLSPRAVVVYDLWPVTAHTLSHVPSLELVICTSAGTDHVDIAECRRRGISVTDAGPAFTADAADYAVALLIAVLRQVAAADRFVRAGTWLREGEYGLGSKVQSSFPSHYPN